MTRLLMPALAAGLTAMSAPVSADDDYRCRLQPGQTMLSQSEVAKRLEAKGYGVRRLKMDDGCYEVYLTDAKGARLEAYVHPATAAIVRSERDD